MDSDLLMTYSAKPCSNKNDSECVQGFGHYQGMLGCGGIFTASFSFFTSPWYPDPYPNNVECIYKVTGAVGLFISIEIVETDIKCDPFGSFSDLLEIRDGDSETSPLIGRYCGNKSYDLPKEMSTSQNDLWIRSV